MMNQSNYVLAGSFYDVLASNIRQARLSANMTQTMLADRIDINQPILSRIESRKNKPSMEIVFLIAKCTGTSIENLCEQKMRGIAKSNEQQVISPNLGYFNYHWNQMPETSQHAVMTLARDSHSPS